MDLILTCCLAELKGRPQPAADEDPIIRSATPKPWANIRVFCEISFTHSINHTPNSEGVVVGGRVDHGVLQLVNRSNRRFIRSCSASRQRSRATSNYGQLVTYLASLRESHINQGMTDSSVYGVATDGLKFVFVTITHEGVLLFSKQFDVLHEAHLPIVLGWLRYILEKAVAMSPGNSSQKSGVLQNEDGADEDLKPGYGPYKKGHGDYGDDGSDDDSLDA